MSCYEKPINKELEFGHISNALQKATVICFAKNLGNENSQPALICFVNLDSFLQVFTSYSVFIKSCREKEGREIEVNLAIPQQRVPGGSS